MRTVSIIFCFATLALAGCGANLYKVIDTCPEGHEPSSVRPDVRCESKEAHSEAIQAGVKKVQARGYPHYDDDYRRPRRRDIWNDRYVPRYPFMF